jgi:hypothetical protein
MNIITRGLGQNTTLITRGYGAIRTIVQSTVEYFVSTIIKVRSYSRSLISSRKL